MTNPAVVPSCGPCVTCSAWSVKLALGLWLSREAVRRAAVPPRDSIVAAVGVGVKVLADVTDRFLLSPPRAHMS